MLKKLRSFFSKDKTIDLGHALSLPINTPDVLDLLWSVYMKSKDPAAVRRIISVLDRKDIVRAKLESWLANVDLQDRDAITARKLLGKLVFPIDYEARRIEGPLDLDIHVALSARAGELKFAQLPCQLTPQECLHLAMKSAALWSLVSMAKQDPNVAAICDQELRADGGAGRLVLRKSLGKK